MGTTTSREYSVNFDDHASAVIDFVECGDRLGPLPESDLPYYAYLTGVYLRDELVGFFHSADAPVENEALFGVIRNLRDYNIHFYKTKSIRETLETPPGEVSEAIRGIRSRFDRKPQAGRDPSERVPNGVLALGVERPVVRHAVLGKMLRMFDFHGRRRLFLDTSPPEFATYLSDVRGHRSVQLIMPWDNDVVLRFVRHFPLYRAMFAIFGDLRFVVAFLPAEIEAFLNTPIWCAAAFRRAWESPVISFPALAEHMNIEYGGGESAKETARLFFEEAVEALGTKANANANIETNDFGDQLKAALAVDCEALKAHDFVFRLLKKKIPPP